MKLNRRMLDLVYGKKHFLYLSIIMGSLATLFVVSQAFILSLVIGYLADNKFKISFYLVPLCLFALFAFLRFLSEWLADYSSDLLGNKINNQSKSQLISRIMGFCLKHLRNQETGELINTVTNGTDSLNLYFSKYIPSLFHAIISPILILSFVFYVDYISGIILIVTAPLIPVFMYLIGDKAKAMTDKQWKTLSYLSAYFLDVIQGLSTLKLFGKSKVTVKKISDLSEEFRVITMKTLKVAFVSSLALELAATLSTAVLAVSVGLRLLDNGMTYVQALFVLIIAPEFYLPLRQLGANFHAGMEGESSSKRIFEILDSPINNEEAETDAILDIHEKKIVFDSVSYRYTENSDFSLNDLSLTIRPGEKIGIVGDSGCGKTTFLNLLLKYLSPVSGEIKVGNTNLNQIACALWRKNIAYIPQKPYIFNGTIRENICLGNKSVSDEKIHSVLDVVFLSELIKGMKLGIETIVGERGYGLSSGQIQRIAIARAIFKDSPIVLLDEPTSNIDTVHEQAIQ